jgi:hypothetical protein
LNGPEAKMGRQRLIEGPVAAGKLYLRLTAVVGAKLPK